MKTHEEGQSGALALGSGSALDAENQRIASEAAEFIHRELSELKGPWVVHEQSFLPANVECDHGGRCHFDAILARHVLAAIRKSQVNLPNTGYEPRDCGEKLKP